jgi:hypothetical protein
MRSRGLDRLSEWCCAPRWKALLIWMLLSAVAGEINLRFMYDLVDFLNYQFTSYAPDWVLSFLGDSPAFIWPMASVYLLLAWFQPILLGLNLTRSLSWIALWIVVPALIMQVLPIGFNTFVSFLQAAFPGLVLMRWRSRPWMTIPAAVLYTALLHLLELPQFAQLPIGNLHLTVGVTAYGAVLLHGTRLLPGCTIFVARVKGTTDESGRQCGGSGR